MPTVNIYTTRWCTYCRIAKALLQKKGIAFTEIDLMHDYERRSEMMARAKGQTA